MVRWILLFFASMIIVPVGAQTESEQLKEIEIDTVSVTAHRKVRSEVSVGTRVSEIGVQVLQGNQTRSLSELLSNNSMVYIKSMGQGAQATSSFRGAGSSHTQVNWNGITINPNMSSSFDFSQIPVFFADHVMLYHGNSHLKNGTGALGGSINIDNTPDWTDTTRLRAFAEYGSYDTYTGAAAARFVKEKSLYQTRVYYQQSDNDYRYLNKVFTQEPFYERRQEAQYKQAGLMQEAYFKVGRYGTISNNLWLQYGNRRLPQPIIVNVTQHEKQRTLGLKYLFDYTYQRDRHKVSAKAAYVLDLLDYDQWFDSEFFTSHDKSFNRSQSFHVIGDYTYRASNRLDVNASVKYSYDKVDANSYSESSIGRNVAVLQGSVRWETTDWLSLSGQVMGELNDSKFAPTFSVGASTQIASKLSAKANVAYNYKFPSMNDLYWQPGGNPDLKPEHGFSYDLTFSYTPRLAEGLYLKAEATYYLMNIDDWIMWLPTQTWYWEPRNVQNVLSHGLELSTETTWLTGDWTFKLGLSYTYSPSINRQRNFEGDNTYYKQLPYVPLHKANARLRADFKGWFFTYQVHYIGVRYTSADETYSTNAYTIHNAELGYDIRVRQRYKLTPRIRVDNLFNAYYESTQYYPMPLRSILGSITFTF